LGAISSLLVIPTENIAASQIHSSDLEGERSQLRTGLGIDSLTRRLSRSERILTLYHESAL
jgi:hypothetical protein